MVKFSKRHHQQSMHVQACSLRRSCVRPAGGPFSVGSMSKMSGLCGSRLPSIAASVGKPNRCCDEFVDSCIVKACNVYRIKSPAESLQVSPTKRADSAVLAEEVVHAMAGELVLCEGVKSSCQAEICRWHDAPPVACLSAD